MTAVAYLISFALVLLSLFIIRIYIKRTVRKNKIINAFSQLDVLLLQRADLIPELIAILKKNVIFDDETFQNISALSSPVYSEKDNNLCLQAEEGSSSLKQILVQMEDYPEHKFNRQFLQLKHEFTECEKQLTEVRLLLISLLSNNNSRVISLQ